MFAVLNGSKKIEDLWPHGRNSSEVKFHYRKMQLWKCNEMHFMDIDLNMQTQMMEYRELCSCPMICQDGLKSVEFLIFTAVPDQSIHRRRKRHLLNFGTMCQNAQCDRRNSYEVNCCYREMEPQ
ncbi:uncharacterized protein LOC134218037 [Armigeres subalbatus]|uniref:uncharacterized protein LOC134218037 n=1 Tax=Armigeres subalbatus TaxID=124917 RepID=UPI002ED47F42